MKKQTARPLIIILVMGIVLIGLMFLGNSNSKESLTMPKDDWQTEIASVVKDFIESSYIKEDFKKVINLYVPPAGFETLLSTEPMSKDEYVEWYVRSVDLKSRGPVKSVRIIDIEEVSDQEQITEVGDNLYRVRFHFIKESGRAVYFGPCCGDNSAPDPNMFVRVLKTKEGYRVYEDLPYIP